MFRTNIDIHNKVASTFAKDIQVNRKNCIIKNKIFLITEDNLTILMVTFI